LALWVPNKHAILYSRTILFLTIYFPLVFLYHNLLAILSWYLSDRNIDINATKAVNLVIYQRAAISVELLNGVTYLEL